MKILEIWDLRNDFHWAGKIKQPACKTLRVWTKSEENFEIFQEKFEIFWSKYLWKIEFFHNVLLNISWSSASSDSIYSWKITPDFFNNFPISGGVPVLHLPTLLKVEFKPALLTYPDNSSHSKPPPKKFCKELEDFNDFP